MHVDTQTGSTVVVPSALVSTDLHGHTLFSDGRATPEEFVDFRRALGMRAIAVSDHDVMSAVRPAARAASRANIVLFPALEVTAHLHFGAAEEEQFHVLAYYSPDVLRGRTLESRTFFQRGLVIAGRWQDFVLDWLSSLPEADRLAVDPDSELERRLASDFPALQSMITKIATQRPSLSDAFRIRHIAFWSSAGPNADLFGWSPEDAIDAIRADGAVDIVAHAGRYRDRARTAAVLDYASGVEVYTSRHKATVATALRDYAEANGKLWTASSDDHQNARYLRPEFGTPAATLSRFLGRPWS